MSYFLLFGLYSWLLVGVFAGFAAPGFLALGRPRAIALALVGALAGGLLATALGFGGLASFDWRSLITATLTSVLALLAVRVR